MPPSHRTSATIPRFDEHQALEAFGPATAEEALTHFSIALQLHMVDEEGVRQWAKAFVRLRARVPDWVWALLEPEAPVGKLIDAERPFADLCLQPYVIIPKLREAVERGHLEVFEAGRYINDLRARAGFTMETLEGGVFWRHGKAALDEFLNAWMKEEFFRRTNEPRSSPEDHPDLDGAFQRFWAIWERYARVRTQF